ncbi:glycoside hydrolase family 18 protein [Sarocladium strictum]
MGFAPSLLVAVVGTMVALPSAMAGFDANANDNIAIYWGQNSYGQGSGQLAQQPLTTYCANTDIDIIPIAFMNGITPPMVNFANTGDSCTAFAGNSWLLDCPQIEADIKTCQSQYGKTILISLGGATYTQGGWSSASAAQAAAQQVWDMFGPVNSSSAVQRPFGSAVIDGFDFDFEATTNNVAAFGQKLRSLINSRSVSKPIYLTAAPQCVYPDAANGPALQGAVAFDFIMIQFYNNWCGTSNFQEGSSTQNAFNFDVWDNWAKTVSANPNVRILLGIPANTGAGGGYTSGSKLQAAINWSKQYSSFGGVMMWDMSQLYANSGFLGEVVSDLGSGGGTVPTKTSATSVGTTKSVPTTTTKTTTTKTTTRSTTAKPAPTGSLVNQWGQCGGEGYKGSTQCKPPYKCVVQSVWWADCR